MLGRSSRVVVFAAVVTGCGGGSVGPARRAPTSLQIVASPAATTNVGTLAGTLTVKAIDAAGDPVAGVVVTFVVSLGAGNVAPTADTTGADGAASTAFTVGATPGANELTALVAGITPVKVAVTGLVGGSRLITLSPASVRLTVSQDTTFVIATPRDSFANNTNAPVAWTSRNPALVTATPGATSNIGVIRVASRPGQTYVVAASGAATDSVLVSVQDASSTPCTFVASPTDLAVGGSLTFDTGVACIRSSVVGAEYALVSHYNTPASQVSTSILVTPNGIVPPTSPFPSPPPGLVVTGPIVTPDFGFELQLRQRERREMGTRVAGARAWFSARASVADRRQALISKSLREGDLIDLNVNDEEFCSNPKIRKARVAAITTGAVVLADTSNPAGGFTDAEYRSIGVAMDTLVNPVDTTAFGAPSDIDQNGRVGIFFTRAVNELSPRTSSSIVLGFYYARDLLPKQSSAGACPGSNVAEMFYLLVPDINGVASAPRTKAFVQDNVVGTVAHEYQHLINASRRLYVNNAPSADEEVWLNEGLSHIAEELVFYRTSQRAPRGNIDASQLGGGSLARTMFDLYARSNVARYQQYLLLPDGNSPFAANDQLATRGATWSLLRYLADRTHPTADGDFWFRLVNSTKTGTLNLDEVLNGTGVTALTGLRDWSVSVLADENPAASVFQQPSWNFISVISTTMGLTFGLSPRILVNNTTATVTLRGGGSFYQRFAVPQNQEALLQVTSPGGSLSPGIRLTVVRIK